MTDSTALAGLTAQLGRAVAGMAGRPLPAAVQRAVRNGFVDTVAVMLAGRDEAAVSVVRQWTAARGGPGEARVLLGAHRARARDAALINGVAAHALDYDDVGLQGHPSAVLVPALLAEGERLGASGAALSSAYVAGYEVWGELIGRDRDLHHLKGWHPTGVFGTLAAAGAIAALRGLDAAQAAQALGLAASMAAGLTANFGSMAKPFHAGQAAAHGIDAVDLAQGGLSCAPDVLEHPKGLLYAISPAGNVDLRPAAGDPGAPPRLATQGLTIKKYPMCFATHRIIDAALDLVRDHDVQAAQLASVEATVSPAQAAMLRNARPANGLQAKFSLQFAIAAPLVARACGLAELEDAFVRRPDVQAIFERVHIKTVDTRHPSEPTLALSDRLVMRLKDGRVLDSGDIHAARGDTSLPLTDQDLAAKFQDCTRHIDPDRRSRLLDALLRLPEWDSVSQLPQI